MKKKNHNLIGNDIVDLLDSDCQDILDNDRALLRILNPSEIKMVFNSEYPLRTYWSIWAAKEAAFKAINQRLPKIPFIPKKFKVSEDLLSVKYKTARLHLYIEETANYVHALCAFRKTHFGLIKYRISPKNLLNRNTPDGGNMGTCQSNLVRLLLKEQLLNIYPNYTMENFRFETINEIGAPKVFFRNASGETRIPVSLSHHGNYLASAVFAQTGTNA